MNKLEIKAYLTQVYGISIAKVNTRVVSGKTKSNRAGSKDRGSTTKLPDYKLAHVTLAGDETFRFPDLFPAQPYCAPPP